MPHVITTQSITFAFPIKDAKGNVLRTKKKFKNREIETDVVEHVRHMANAVIEVTKEVAKELIAKGHARHHDVALDGDLEEVDPTLA